MPNENVLYRKYRPKGFEEVIGQDHVVSILIQSIISNKVSHAYLFCGPRGTGKTTLARLMSKAVNCANFDKKKDICNECEYCLAVNQNNVDIIEMDAASNRGIEEIRNLKDNINYLPSFLKKKVYIIDEAHMLTKEAFNALLKTLEEPPDHVIFILATTEAHKLPITILSRVQRFDLSLASVELLSDKLLMICSQEGVEIDKSSLDLIYTKSGGSYRDAETLLNKVMFSSSVNKITKEDIYRSLGLVNDEVVERFVSLMIEHNEEAMSFLDSNLAKGLNIVSFLDQLIEYTANRLMNLSEDRINLITLVNLFINIRAQIKDFNNKALLFRLELFKYFGNNISSDEQDVKTSLKYHSIEQAKRVVSENINITKEDARVEIKPIEIHTGNDIVVKELSEFLKHLTQRAMIKFPRLKAILEGSNLAHELENLIIKNRYKFNISYLEKLEIKEFIIASGKEVSFPIGNITILHSQEDPSFEVNQSVDKLSGNSGNIDGKTQVANENGVEKEITKVDNSNVVEKMLL